MRIKYLALPVLLLFSLLAPIIHVSADSTNLITNPSVENYDLEGNPAGWQANHWGNNTAFTSEKISEGHTGSKSLYVSLSSHVDGDAKWIPTAVSVKPNTSYTYTDFFKSTTGTEIDLEYTDTNGNVSYVYVKPLPASSDWTQTIAQFTTPANVAKLSVLHILADNGWLQTDDFSLTTTASSSVPINPSQPTTGNLIANPSFETANGPSPLNWQMGKWGTNATTFSYDNTGHTGSHAATVNMSSYTDGDAKWYAKQVAVTPGVKYTYSDYYKSTTSSSLVAAFTDANGNYSYQDLGTAPVSSSWKAFSSQFTAPTGVKFVSIYHLINSVGSLTIDDVSLVASSSTTPPVTPPVTPPTSDGLIANPSVESSSNGVTPDSWINSSWGNNNATFGYTTDGHTGSHSIKTTITQYTNGDAKWYFEPLTSLKSGTIYSFSAWVKSSTQVQAVVAYEIQNQTTQYVTLTAPQSPNPTVWQKYTTKFSIPVGVKSTTIYMLISGIGWAETDDYSLAPYTPTPFKEGIVSLTFDDGWTSTYKNGLPLLKKYDLKSTQYIISGYIGAPMYMTKNQILQFKQQGSEIGSHTVSHPHLTTLSTSDLTHELRDSQATLQQLFGKSEATSVASPYGEYNAKVIATMKLYYKAHRSVDAGFNSKDNFDPYHVVVQNVDYDTPNTQIESWVNQAKTQRTWLVLVYHQVENTETPGDIYAVKTSNLDTQLKYIKNSGVKVETFGQALKEVSSQE